jgi:hypothetical protein
VPEILDEMMTVQLPSRFHTLIGKNNPYLHENFLSPDALHLIPILSRYGRAAEAKPLQLKFSEVLES